MSLSLKDLNPNSLITCAPSNRLKSMWTPIEEVIHSSFLPSLFGRAEPLPEELKELFSLSPAQGGIGIPILSAKVWSSSMPSSIYQHHTSILLLLKTPPFQHESWWRKGSVKSMLKGELLQSPGLTGLTNRYLLIYSKWCSRPRDKGASSWLNAIPIEEHGLALNKQEFRDSLCLRYNLPLPNLPSYCGCGEMFTVNQALSCKKGGFVAQRHDTIRDLLTSHISKVCRNVETEPFLQPLDNEVFNLQSTVTSRKARLDMKAGGFWTPGVTAFSTYV